MDLWSAIFTVLRRWYVALPILAVSVVAAFVVGGKIEPEYKADATAAFKAPPAIVRDSQTQPFRNPYASDPKTLATLTARVLRSEETKQRFEDQDLSPSYQLSVDQFSAIIDFVVIGNSEAQAIDTADALLAETERIANQIQNVPVRIEDEQVTLQDFPPDQAVRQAGSKPRVMASLMLLGIVAAAGSAFVLESLSNRRKGIVPAHLAANQIPGAFPGGYIQMVQVPAPSTVAMRQPASNGHAPLFEDDVDLDSLLEEVEPEPKAMPRKATPATNGRSRAPGQEINRGKGRRPDRRRDADETIDLTSDPDADPDGELITNGRSAPSVVEADAEPDITIIDEPAPMPEPAAAAVAEPTTHADADAKPAVKPARASKGTGSGHTRASARTNRSRRTSLFAAETAEPTLSGDDANDGD